MGIVKRTSLQRIVKMMTLPFFIEAALTVFVIIKHTPLDSLEIFVLVILGLNAICIPLLFVPLWIKKNCGHFLRHSILGWLAAHVLFIAYAWLSVDNVTGPTLFIASLGTFRSAYCLLVFTAVYLWHRKLLRIERTGTEFVSISGAKA